MFKENKITFISIGIILIAGIVYFVSNMGKNRSTVEFHEFIHPEKILQISIAKEGKKINLFKEKNIWQIELKNKLIVDSPKLLNVFDFVNNSKIIQRVTKNKSIYHKFDLIPEKEMKIEFVSNDRKYLFKLGKTKEYSSVFALKGEDPYVYLLSQNLNLDFESNNWIFKKILDFDSSQIDYIAYSFAKEAPIKLFYEKVSNKFFVKTVPEGKQLVDLNFLKTDFSNISVNNFIDISFIRLGFRELAL